MSEQIAVLWPRCVELGLDVVLDLNFWTRQQRDEVRATAASLGATARLYRLACPDEEAWARIATRNTSLDASSLLVTRATFEAFKDRFEPLGADEAADEVSENPLPLA